MEFLAGIPSTSNTRAPRVEGPFDLAVLGGWINGTVICREAAPRGKSVLLTEKGDLGQGTFNGSLGTAHSGTATPNSSGSGLSTRHRGLASSFKAGRLGKRSSLQDLAPTQPTAGGVTFSLPRAQRTRALPVAAVLGLALACLLGAGWRIHRWASDPNVAFLAPDPEGAWIIADDPFRLALRRARQYQTRFRKDLFVGPESSGLSLTLRAFRAAAVLLDGALVSEPRTDLSRWKEPHEIDLDGRIGPGRHTLEVHVLNENGPPALLAYSAGLGIRSDTSWEASLDGKPFQPVVLASQKKPPELLARFPTALESFRDVAPPLSLIFLLATALAWAGGRGALAGQGSRLPSLAVSTRWAVISALVLMGANNVLRIREDNGFDAIEHFYYIQHVALQHRLPLAPEGWQMFQSPLYYVISAPLLLILRELFDPITVVKLLRVVPIAAGVLHAEVCFRALRRVFPTREDLQALGTLLGGLLPMNLYLSQSLGNEPLASLLSGCVLAELLVLVATPGAAPNARWALRLGLFLGLALLTKVTAVLLVLPVLGALVWAASRSSCPLRRLLATTSCSLGCAALVAGWWYLRNWIALGRPFVGGWDPGRSIVWWQDPGFRTIEHLTTFGTALVQPLYAATAGVWDAIYSTLWTDGYLSMRAEYDTRPPWNYAFLGASALWGLIPSVAILAGAAAWIRRDLRPFTGPILLAAFTCCVLCAALVVLYATLPIYSTGKATYLASGTIPLALLGAAGFGALPRARSVQAFTWGLVVTWGAAAYLGYFVVS